MDHPGWYGFVRHQNLGAHDAPKLGVAATVRRLEIAGDFDGSVYFHNVRVNGIHGSETGPPLAVLLLILNSRLIDWIFRRGAAVHANDYFAANRQFIAGLPIRVPEGAEENDLESLGRRLNDLASSAESERKDLLAWLAGTLGVPSSRLPARQALHSYEDISASELIQRLGRERRRLAVDPRERQWRELIEREHRKSVDRLLPLVTDLAAAEAEADRLVYDVYRLPSAMREMVDSEYPA
jgi:hypothetical protein